MSREVYSGHAVRRAAWQFLTGKAASAVLTFAILLWLVRLLPVAEYGAYVVLIAAVELGFAVAGLGLSWLAARYLPDYRMHADGARVARLCRRLVLWRALALIVLAVVLALAMDAYLRWAGLPGHRSAAWLALVLLVTEGLGRFLREGMMAPLMLQGQARLSLVLRQLAFLGAIAGLMFAEHPELNWVLTAEVGASALGLLAAIIAITRHLYALRTQECEPGWTQPRLAEQWRIALRMYAADLITLAYSPQVFLNLVQRALGAEAAALFGFLRALFEQAARYLPATLLFSVLRPKLMASYLQDDMAALARQVNLAGKLSLFVLLPLVVLVALGGDSLVALLSGHKFEAGGYYLLGLLLALVPTSQRQLIETVAVAAGWAGLCTLGSALGMMALPLMLFLLYWGLGLWAPVLAILFGQIVFNVTVLKGLARLGYRADWQGATKLTASAFLAWLAASATLLGERNAIWLVPACLLAALVFLVAAWGLHAFSAEERQRLDGMLGRRLFAK